jgi:2-methylfumaryl-CoA isomerase
VIAILGAERERARTGAGRYVRISLADVAFATVANLGLLAQAQVLGENRPPLGNHVYGAFGRDFATADGHRVMVAAISIGQWDTLVRATGIADRLPALERAFDADFRKEGDRYRARHAIAAVLEPWFETRSLAEVRGALDDHGVCWGTFQTFTELFEQDWRVSTKNPVFGDVEHPGIGSVRTPASPLLIGGAPPLPPGVAPLLGTHTDEVLHDVLGLSDAEIGRLHDDGLVRGTHEPGISR